MSRSSTSCALLGAVFSLPLFFATAQQPPASPPATSGAGNAVQLSLVVHNKKNEPVLDLKPDDLTITEDGASVRLDDLRLVDPHKDAKQL